MSETSPITAVHELAWTATPLPRCAKHQGSDHVCLPLPDSADLDGLLKAVGAWYGQPLTLDINGSHPLLAPFGEATGRVVRMYAWPCNSRWIGCGTTRSGHGDRTVLLLTDRATPAVRTLPEGLSWVERVLAITGWAEGLYRPPPHDVDWAAVEESLGTALPGDYKQMAEIFGCGAFDGYFRIHVPDAPQISFDIVHRAERLVEAAARHSAIWDPYSVYPERGGLLLWAGTEQGHGTYWLTEHPDPNQWPIMTVDDAHDEWERFDGTTGEFVFRMLTDPLMPFLRAESQVVPWFTRYEGRTVF